VWFGSYTYRIRITFYLIKSKSHMYCIPTTIDTHHESFTEVIVEGVVAATTDRGYILQDPVTAEMISIHDTNNTVSHGDEITIRGQFNVSWNIARIVNIDYFKLEATGATINFDTSQAVDINWVDYNRTDYMGKLIRIENPWARLTGTGSTSYARLAHNDTNLEDQAYESGYLGLQNGANNPNITDTLADLFTEGTTAHHYNGLTLYVFLYDSSSSYNKAVIIGDAHIITD